ncbi:MAG TPA: hypothetical protein VGH91_11345 [Gammaproteobacteria bacterium]|jgi:hypothetical protein
MTENQRGVMKAILWGGLVGGSIDIFSATLINLVSPLLIMRFIAGGLLGPEVIKGGLDISFIGLLLQWLMGIIIAAIYVLASRHLAWMHRDWRVTGAAYGVPMYFVMTYVVVPLSALHHWPTFKLEGFVLNMLAMMLFGLIIAYATQRFAPNRRAT